MFLVLLDIHQNISSAQGFVRCTIPDFNDKIDVVLKTDHICVNFYSNSALLKQLKILMPQNFLKPSTISCLREKNSSASVTFNKEDDSVKFSSLLPSLNHETIDKDIQSFEMTFRVQVSDISTVKSSIFNRVPSLKFRDFMKHKIERNQTYSIICTNCGTYLADKTISFQYIYEYFEGISELSENWFCHKHNDHNCQVKSESLFIGDVYFYISDSVIKLMMLSESDKEYKCIKCFTTLSKKKKMSYPSFIGFFCDKVMLQKSSEEPCSIEKYKTNSALFSFCSILEDILNSACSCKIYLESRVEDKTECLLLWVNCKRIAQFLLIEMNKDDIPSETEFKVNEIFKVLYCVCSPDSEIAKKWKHDFYVEFFQISDNMISVLCELLQKSSEYFPRNQETIKGFSFGYLPLPAFVS